MKQPILLIWRNRFDGARTLAIKQKFVLGALVVAGAATVVLAAGRAQASALPLSPVPAGLVVIYSNLGPADSYDPSRGWCLYVNQFPPPNPALRPPSPQAVAMAFTGN